MVSRRPRPQFTPGKDPVPVVQEAGWAPGPVWTGGKSRLHRDSILDRPARSSVTIPTELPGPYVQLIGLNTVPTYTDMSRLTTGIRSKTGIRSEKCVVRRFRRCAKVL